MLVFGSGCGRGCKFCDVTLRALRYYPPEKVKKEIEINLKKGGEKSAWIHSDDIFVYGMDPKTSKGMEPNREALEASTIPCILGSTISGISSRSGLSQKFTNLPCSVRPSRWNSLMFTLKSLRFLM